LGVQEAAVLGEEILEAWTVPPLPPFDAEDVKLPVLVDGEDIPFPIEFTGHFPNNSMLTNEDKDRLNAFYERKDEQTYLLQKNKYKRRNRFYLKVEDTLSLKPGSWVKDGILNFEQYRSKQMGKLCVGYFPSFFLSCLVDSESRTGQGYQYSKVTNWSQTYLGCESPLSNMMLSCS
jgi:hypothetical protein